MCDAGRVPGGSAAEEGLVLGAGGVLLWEREGGGEGEVGLPRRLTAARRGCG